MSKVKYLIMMLGLVAQVGHARSAPQRARPQGPIVYQQRYDQGPTVIFTEVAYSHMGQLRELGPLSYLGACQLLGMAPASEYAQVSKDCTAPWVELSLEGSFGGLNSTLIGWDSRMPIQCLRHLACERR